MTLSTRLVAALAVATVASIAQTPTRPEFEVASIKSAANCANGRGPGGPASPGRLSLNCVSVRSLIRVSYGGAFLGNGKLSATRLDVVGGPAWLDSEFYDINAKAAGPASLDQTAGAMLQALLEDRCKLKVHKESKEVPVYSLTVGKSGPKLKASKADSCVPLDFNHPNLPFVPGQPRPNPCGFPVRRVDSGGTIVDDVHGITMAEFAGRMLTDLHRPVIDRTGLTGTYDIHLEYLPGPGVIRPQILNGVETSAPVPPTDDTAGSAIFTAVQDQLGLKLSAEKGSVDVIVVDSIEKPSAN